MKGCSNRSAVCELFLRELDCLTQSVGRPLDNKVQIDSATRRRGGLFFHESPSENRITDACTLFVGDIFGKPGRRILQDKLHGIIQEYRVDLCIANVEKCRRRIRRDPADCRRASGFRNRPAHFGQSYLGQARHHPLSLRATQAAAPAQLSCGNPGTGIYIGDTRCGVRFGLLNLQGRVFMAPSTALSRRDRLPWS